MIKQSNFRITLFYLLKNVNIKFIEKRIKWKK